MDVIIEDEYIEQMGEYLSKEAEDIEEKIIQYIAILNGICTKGITKGETAKALAEFKEQAEVLKGIAEYGHTARRYCINYISRVDEADGDLY